MGGWTQPPLPGWAEEPTCPRPIRRADPNLLVTLRVHKVPADVAEWAYEECSARGITLGTLVAAGLTMLRDDTMWPLVAANLKGGRRGQRHHVR